MSDARIAAIEALINAEVERRLAEASAGAAPPLTVDEFAAKTRLASSTVYSLIRRGQLKTLDTGTRRVLIPSGELTRILNG